MLKTLSQILTATDATTSKQLIRQSAQAPVRVGTFGFSLQLPRNASNRL